MVVCDSAHLIHLSRVGRLDILKEIFKDVKIPDSVYREVVTEAKDLGKPGVRGIEEALEDGWIEVVEAKNRQDIDNLSESERIEIEDAEVICLARVLSEGLVTSDGWLVKVAGTLGIRVIWTTTVVLMAAKKGVTSKEEARQLLRDLVRSGLYLRADVYAALVDEIGCL